MNLLVSLLTGAGFFGAILAILEFFAPGKAVPILRFLVSAGANLIADAVQIEGLLGAGFVAGGLNLALNSGNPEIVRIAGLISSAVGVAVVTLPKAIAAGKVVETDLETLLRLADHTTPPVPHG